MKRHSRLFLGISVLEIFYNFFFLNFDLELERIAKQAKAARRAPRFSIPNVRDSSEGLSSDFISQMDKEVEEILSSSDDEDTAMDDFVPGVVNDGNDENTDSGKSNILKDRFVVYRSR